MKLYENVWKTMKLYENSIEMIWNYMKLYGKNNENYMEMYGNYMKITYKII